MSDESEKFIKVFISYSHDSEAHQRRVLALSDRLRRDRIDCNIDQYEGSPAEGWPAWMDNQIEDAEFVLVVCTEKYFNRAKGKETPGVGSGARWETLLTNQTIYDTDSRNEKFVPIYFDPCDKNYIPKPLRPVSRYCLCNDEGYKKLFRRLLNIPPADKPPLGELKRKFGLSPAKPLQRKEEFFDPPELADDQRGIPRLAPFLQTALKPTTVPSQPEHPGFELVSTVAANFRTLMTDCIRPLTWQTGVREVDILVAYRIGDIHLDLHPLRSRPGARLRACLLDMWDKDLMKIHQRKYYDRTPAQLRSRVIDSIGGLLGACEFDEFPLRLTRLDDPPTADYQIRLISQRITFAYYRIDEVAFVIPLDMKKEASPAPWGWAVTKDNAPKAYEHFLTEYDTIFAEAESGRVYPA